MAPVTGSVFATSTASAPETFALGEAVGRQLVEFDFVGLTGQLGAGKTQFSRGVAQGAGVPLDDVSSPTYSILQTYRGRLVLHHADLYRLTTVDDLYSVGYFDALEQPAAMLVEWVDQVQSARPDDCLHVRIAVTGPERRDFEFVARGPRALALLQRVRGALTTASV